MIIYHDDNNNNDNDQYTIFLVCNLLPLVARRGHVREFRDVVFKDVVIYNNSSVTPY